MNEHKNRTPGYSKSGGQACRMRPQQQPSLLCGQRCRWPSCLTWEPVLGLASDARDHKPLSNPKALPPRLLQIRKGGLHRLRGPPQGTEQRSYIRIPTRTQLTPNLLCTVAQLALCMVSSRMGLPSNLFHSFTTSSISC